MKKIIFLLFSFFFVSISSFAQLDAKSIASNYYKGVVKILLFDSAAEKKEAGKGYISRGSGFIVNEDGIIFTNRHVVEFCVYGYAEYDYYDKDNGSKIKVFDTYTSDLATNPDVVKVHRTGFAIPIVQVYTGKGENDYKLYKGEVLTVGMGSFDGAMVKIVSDMNGKPVNTKFFSLPIGDSDKSQQGEDLCIFGFPAQYDGSIDLMIKDMSTLTFGKLSGYDYVFNKDYGYIKTDASINSGNSGGPVFSESNKVIGIATATGNKTNIGLVGGINGMYYVAAAQGAILKQLVAKGLTIPENAGSIQTVSGERVQILSADEINVSKTGSTNASKGNKITFGNSKKPEANNGGSYKVSSNYYNNSKVTFTSRINDDGSLGPKLSEFTIDNKNKGLIYIDIDNYPKQLKTDKLIVDVFMKQNGEYKKTETKTFNITPTVKASFFKYNFTQPGDYKFAIYNQGEAWINNGFITVRK